MPIKYRFAGDTPPQTEADAGGAPPVETTMTNGGTRERDLVLAPNEYAFISDQTKGNINTYVGPFKTSLANTDQPVMFNEQSKRFEDCSLETATQVFATAPEGWYVVMKNPGKNGDHPPTGTVNNLPNLIIGHKVNIPGPVSFALWPGQMVRVIKGHNLRSNQYLLVRVYEEETAKREWTKAVVKPQSGSDSENGASVRQGAQPDLTIGQTLVIKGTDISFYIPPTGIEVVRDNDGAYVREAVTLERLEYCILLDEDGNKRFIPGPAVVFPEPTEAFVEKNGSRKFKAMELNELSGIYIKVIAPYSENGREYKIGEELFITGSEQRIYFPRPEHALIRYGDRTLNHAVAIPEGEGRYCLNRLTGKISLVIGPKMFLPDPRTEVIVRRVLEPKQVALWFPGNQEALEYNQRLKQMMEASGGTTLTAQPAAAPAAPAPMPMARAKAVSESYVGDDFSRQQSFTAPRSITLDTKYEGAVTISVWTGYAVQIVGKTGERRVVVGPATVLLAYDETLEAMELSTGTPKRDEPLMRTAYVRVLHNKVSDIVSAESMDMCQVRVRLSYRVNFEGEPKLWFNVENYVKFLTDHMRSVLRNAIKKIGVQQFYAQAIDIIRDTVLGKAEPGGKRAGRAFSENGMRIYDVEVLDVVIGDETIQKLLTDTQHAVVNRTLALEEELRRLAYVEQSEAVKRHIAESEAETAKLNMDLRVENEKKQLLVNLAVLDSQLAARKKGIEAQLDEQTSLDKIGAAELSRRRASRELDLALAGQELEQRLSEVREEVKAVVSKAAAVSPDLVAALQAFSDRALVAQVSESMAPLAILGGDSVADVVARLLKGTALENVVKKKS